jgi:hypothetical protein
MLILTFIAQIILLDFGLLYLLLYFLLVEFGSEGKMNKQMIAPCGMNCGICGAYLREKNRCVGCNVENPNKLKTRLHCKIKYCENLTASGEEYCCYCNEYPCARLKHLDKRYRTNYTMSMIENLNLLKEIGIEAFLEKEIIRWKCKECGGVICVHTKKCSECGLNLYPK